MGHRDRGRRAALRLREHQRGRLRHAGALPRMPVGAGTRVHAFPRLREREPARLRSRLHRGTRRVRDGSRGARPPAQGGRGEKPPPRAVRKSMRSSIVARRFDARWARKQQQRRSRAMPRADARPARRRAATEAQGGGDESSRRSGTCGQRERRRTSRAGRAAPDGAALPQAVARPREAIPSGEDDDIIARRLRKAAEEETDPELKEKLWNEYRDYKQNTRGGGN